MCLSAAVMGDVTHVRLSIVTASLLMFALNSAGLSFEAAYTPPAFPSEAS